MTTVACTIVGEPRAPDRHRRGVVQPWRDAAVADLTRARAGRDTITTPVVVDVLFRFTVPKRPRHWWQRPGGPHATRPSLAHLTMTVLDALLDAAVVADLEQVDGLVVKTIYARADEAPGSLIIVSLWDGGR